MDWIRLRGFRCAGLGTLAVVALCAGGRANADEPAERGEVRVARLIRDLGASDYSRRRAADDELKELGADGRRQLEAALDDPDVEIRLRARRLLDRLKLDELWSAARVEVKASGQPASKVLQAIAEQTGNHIHVGDPYGNFSEKVLEADFAPTTYWEAVDSICQQTGNRIRPHYDMHTPGVVASAGAGGGFPRAYAGPVRAQITSARREFIEELNYEDEKAELAHSFKFNLQFMWEDRFRMVGYATQPELVEARTDEQVVVSAAASHGGGWNAGSRGLRQVAASLKLNPVPITSKSLSVLKIRWGLVAIGDPAVLELSDLALDKLHTQDDVALRIEAIEKHAAGKYVVSLGIVRDLADPEPREILFQEYDVELVDAEGRAFRQQTTTPSTSERGVQLKVAFLGESPDSQPARLRLHYPKLRAHRDVELVFRDVPLPVSKPE